jgi:hypothetical protein
MAVDFDAHIQYFSYNNVQGDDFAVGYLDNKDGWVERINRWQANDGFDTRFTIQEWDELEQDDFRGLELAEVEPDENGGFNVAWTDGKADYSLNIDSKSEISFIGENEKPASVPRWFKKLAKTIKNQQN